MRPILLQIGDYPVFSYPLFLGLAWGIGIQLFLYAGKRFSFRSTHPIMNIVAIVGVFISAFIGAKVFFLMSSGMKEFSTLALSKSFWMGGGFVFYGGLIGASLFMLFLIFSRKVSADILYGVFPALCWAHGIGRVGCFLAGCCFGITYEGGQSQFQLPVQLFESAALITLAIYLQQKAVNFYQENHNSGPWKLAGLYFLNYSIIRFCLEFGRGDIIRGVYGGVVSTSQIISLVLIAIVLIAKFIPVKRLQ